MAVELPAPSTPSLQERLNLLSHHMFREISGLTPTRVFHYTRAETMKSILQTGKLWACDVENVTDCSELLYTVGVFRAHIQRFHAFENDPAALPLMKALCEFSQGLPNRSFVFTLSFCEYGNDLDMYRLYADRSAGLSFGVDFSVIANNGGWVSRCNYSIDQLDDFCLTSVHALRACYLQDIRAGITPNVTDYVQQFYERAALHAPSFKPRVWRGEREWRVVIFDPPQHLIKSAPNGRRYVEYPAQGVLPIATLFGAPHLNVAAFNAELPGLNVRPEYSQLRAIDPTQHFEVTNNNAPIAT